METSDQPVLNLNEVEKQEIEEAQGLAAGTTNPYGKEQYATGLQTASAERGKGLGYGPGNTPASANPGQASSGMHAGDGLQDAGLGATGPAGAEPHGLQKVKEGLQELVGLK